MDDPIYREGQDLDGFFAQSQRFGYSGNWWEIPVSIALLCLAIWAFTNGLLGLLVLSPFIIWYVLMLWLSNGWHVFIGLLIAGLLALLMLVTFFG